MGFLYKAGSKEAGEAIGRHFNAGKNFLDCLDGNKYPEEKGTNKDGVKFQKIYLCRKQSGIPKMAFKSLNSGGMAVKCVLGKVVNA